MPSYIGSGDHQPHARVDQPSGTERLQAVDDDLVSNTWLTLGGVSALIAFLSTGLESVLGLRILIKLIEGTPSNPFGNAVCNFTSRFVAPFNGLSSNPTNGELVLEVTTIIAMVVYALIAWGLIRLAWWSFYRPALRLTRFEHEQILRESSQ